MVAVDADVCVYGWVCVWVWVCVRAREVLSCVCICKRMPEPLPPPPPPRRPPTAPSPLRWVSAVRWSMAQVPTREARVGESCRVCMCLCVGGCAPSARPSARQNSAIR